MSLRALFLLILGALITAFIAVNWTAVTAPTTLNLLFMEINAPLGLVLLGLMVLLSAVFVGFIAYTQGTVLMETRRHAKELAAQRELADKAEASRFTDLRAHLDAEVARLTNAMAQQANETLSRIDRAEVGLREHSGSLDLKALRDSLEDTNRQLLSRIDRLEMGLRDGLTPPRSPAPAASPAPAPAAPDLPDAYRLGHEPPLGI